MTQARPDIKEGTGLVSQIQWNLLTQPDNAPASFHVEVWASGWICSTYRVSLTFFLPINESIIFMFGWFPGPRYEAL